MLRYGYFDSDIIGVDDEGMPIFDRAETSDLFALLFAGLISNGVLAQPANCFQVIATNSMAVEIRPGFGMIKGHFCYDDETQTLTVGPAPEKYSRIDRVVMRCNYLDRMMEIIIKRGAEAARPVPPALIRPSAGDYFELCLADIRLSPKQKMITQSSITDTRPDSSVCGYITQLIDHLDTAAFFGQLNKFYEEFVDKSETSYAEFQRMAQAAYRKFDADITSYINALKKDSTDAYEGMIRAMDAYFDSLSSRGKKKYEAFQKDITAYINALRAKGDADLAEIIGQLTGFMGAGEQDFMEWFASIKGTLESAQNGELFAELARMFRELYSMATEGDIDRIIGGTYIEVDDSGGIFEPGTDGDIDSIIGGSYEEAGTQPPWGAARQDIAEIVDNAFKGV